MSNDTGTKMAIIRRIAGVLTIVGFLLVLLDLDANLTAFVWMVVATLLWFVNESSREG